MFLDMFESEEIKANYIANKRLDLEIARLIDVYESELKMLDISSEYFNESEGDSEAVDAAKQNKFVELMSNIYEAILKSMAKFFERISDIFSKKDETSGLSTEDFLKSNTGKVELHYTLNRAQDTATKKIAEGNALIKKLSKATKIDDRVIEKYVEDSADFLSNMKATDVVEAGAIVHAYSKYTDTYKEFKDGGLKSIVKNVTDPASKGQSKRVLLAIGRYYQDMNTIYTEAYSQMKDLKRKTYENMKQKGQE